MVIEGFIWLDWVVNKITQKHNIDIEEVEEVFRNRPKFFKKEKGRVEGEHLYNALGQTDSGRYFIYKATKHALIVSARDMNQKERRSYVKK